MAKGTVPDIVLMCWCCESQGVYNECPSLDMECPAGVSCQGCWFRAARSNVDILEQLHKWHKGLVRISGHSLWQASDPATSRIAARACI